MHAILPEITVLSDNSVGKEHEDLFHLSSKLAPILDIVRHRDTELPLAMAIYGQSGTGKSTCLRWLEDKIGKWNKIPEGERMSHPRIVPVWLQPSLCGTEECVLRHMLAACIVQCLSCLEREDLRREYMLGAMEQFGRCLGYGFVAELQALAKKWGLHKELPPYDAGRAKEDWLQNPPLSVSAAFILRLLEALRVEGGESRIVVFVDDLDRCQPGLIMEVFEAIHSKLRLFRMLFVVALDHSIAQAVIEGHFKSHGCGELQMLHYLGRIFQVECHVEPSPQQLQSFYQTQFDLLDYKTGGVLGGYLSSGSAQYIGAAIMHLSEKNPRKIKLLLNSALMVSHGVLRQRIENKSAAALLIAQRIQVFLLRQWLSYFSVGGSAIHRSDVLEWFCALSKEACSSAADFEHIVDLQTKDSAGTQGSRNPVRSFTTAEDIRREQRMKPPPGFSFSMIHEWVWDLLRIPFNPDIDDLDTRSFSLEEPVKPVHVEIDRGMLAASSSALIDALASNLGEAATDIAPADLQRIVSLDLSGRNLEANDFLIIAGMQQLKRLDLDNSGIELLDWIKDLQNLKILNLACTQVSDIRQLENLENLISVDLSCTQVEDIGPISGMKNLTTLLLYNTPVKNLSPLSGLSRLEQVNLSHTLITDGELVHLEGCTALKSLYLQETEVSQRGCSKLNQALQFNLRIFK